MSAPHQRDEANGFRIQAAVQFGFRWTNDDADEYACTESQLIAFAKACERKGMADVRAQLRELESAFDAVGIAGSASASLMSGAISAAADGLDTQIAAIDAELAPILEVERQRVLAELCVDEGCPQHGTPHVCINRGESKCADCEPAPVSTFDLCVGGFPIKADACDECGATMDESCGRVTCS